MATYLGTSAVFEVRSTATAGNLGGGGFNPANANFPTDGAATSATGNSPVFTSASYTFVAGDVGAWIYIKSGTNWTSGWYQIASVAAGAATLSAAVGQGVQISNNRYLTNTVAGVATVASPTGATWGIDYSQQNAAQFTATTGSGATTTFTDATNVPGINWIGNFLCLKTGTGLTAGWYECTNVSGGNVTLDRTAGTSYSAVTYYLGGAVSLGGSTTGITDVIFFALGANATTSGCRFFLKGGSSVTYTPNAAITTLVGNVDWPSIYEGYATTRGDRPTGSTRPTIACGSNTFTTGARSQYHSLVFSGAGTATALVTSGQSLYEYCKFLNNNTTANSTAVYATSVTQLISCEAVCYRGYATQDGGGMLYAYGCYIHDSNMGYFTNVGNVPAFINCIFAGNVTNAIDINISSPGIFIAGNTIYGAENKLGTGILSVQSAAQWVIMNNIFYGLATGVSFATGVNNSAFCDYNDYNNNTADTSNFNKGTHDIAVNPSFTSVAQVTGSGATSTTTTLTDGTKNFTTAGVVAGRDYLQVTSATGVTLGIYGITAVGTTTLTTDLSLGTGSAISYQITTGRNFLPTASQSSIAGYPGVFPAALTTGHLNVGAAQEAAGGGSSASSFTFGS